MFAWRRNKRGVWCRHNIHTKKQVKRRKIDVVVPFSVDNAVATAAADLVREHQVDVAADDVVVQFSRGFPALEPGALPEVALVSPDSEEFYPPLHRGQKPEDVQLYKTARNVRSPTPIVQLFLLSRVKAWKGCKHNAHFPTRIPSIVCHVRFPLGPFVVARAVASTSCDTTPGSYDVIYTPRIVWHVRLGHLL